MSRSGRGGLQAASSPQRYGWVLRNLFNLKDSDSLTPPGALTPTIVLENDRPENFWHSQTLVFADSTASAASVGNTSHAGIRNPASSGYVATCFIGFPNEAGAGFAGQISLVNPSNANLVVVAGVRVIDGRGFANFAPALSMISFQGANQSNNIHHVRVPTDAMYWDPAPWILSPGTDLFVSNPVLNSPIRADVWGWVRSLGASEIIR